jgi:hypothetical protein
MDHIIPQYDKEIIHIRLGAYSGSQNISGVGESIFCPRPLAWEVHNETNSEMSNLTFLSFCGNSQRNELRCTCYVQPLRKLFQMRSSKRKCKVTFLKIENNVLLLSATSWMSVLLFLTLFPLYLWLKWQDLRREKTEATWVITTWFSGAKDTDTKDISCHVQQTFKLSFFNSLAF